MTDQPLTPEELGVVRARREAANDRSRFPREFIYHARTDVPRLLATVDAAHRESASLRHAALFAAGVRGGPGAWRWASDPAGTILDDVAAWERLLGEIAQQADKARLYGGVVKGRDHALELVAALEERTAPPRPLVREGRCAVCDWPLKATIEEGCTAESCSYQPEQGSDEWHRIQLRRAALAGVPTPIVHVPDGETAPRKPVAGWRRGIGDERALSTPIGMAWAYSGGLWSVPNKMGNADSLESAQLAAEDELFAIADGINALRGGR